MLSQRAEVAVGVLDITSKRAVAAHLSAERAGARTPQGAGRRETSTRRGAVACVVGCGGIDTSRPYAMRNVRTVRLFSAMCEMRAALLLMR